MQCCFSSQAGSGSFSASLQEDARSDLSEIKGHLEIALLEKHFLREYILLRMMVEERDSQCQ